LTALKKGFIGKAYYRKNDEKKLKKVRKPLRKNDEKKLKISRKKTKIKN